jgi:hypothetical protein
MDAATTYRINEPDFRAEPWKETRHDGRRVWISVCYELVEGRWEGFVAIRFGPPAA